ncbi:MAG: hypothetical protein V1838_02160 [Patescibacteria group bacterium]
MEPNTANAKTDNLRKRHLVLGFSAFVIVTISLIVGFYDNNLFSTVLSIFSGLLWLAILAVLFADKSKYLPMRPRLFTAVYAIIILVAVAGNFISTRTDDRPSVIVNRLNGSYVIQKTDYALRIPLLTKIEVGTELHLSCQWDYQNGIFDSMVKNKKWRISGEPPSQHLTLYVVVHCTSMNELMEKHGSFDAYRGHIFSIFNKWKAQYNYIPSMETLLITDLEEVMPAYTCCTDWNFQSELSL